LCIIKKSRRKAMTGREEEKWEEKERAKGIFRIA
jgi:hypothetical protein